VRAKPQWKSVVELIVGLVVFLCSAGLIVLAINGGPGWYWIGVLSLLGASSYVAKAWDEI
jgi:ABC-type nickel/cobalt efflux system permease component RcnA